MVLYDDVRLLMRRCLKPMSLARGVPSCCGILTWTHDQYRRQLSLGKGEVAPRRRTCPLPRVRSAARRACSAGQGKEKPQSGHFRLSVRARRSRPVTKYSGRQQFPSCLLPHSQATLPKSPTSLRNFALSPAVSPLLCFRVVEAVAADGLTRETPPISALVMPAEAASAAAPASASIPRTRTGCQVCMPNHLQSISSSC